MESYAVKLKNRLNDAAYDYRRESFIRFLKSPVRNYKESPTVKDYVDISDEELERMANGEDGGQITENLKEVTGDIVTIGNRISVSDTLKNQGVEVYSLSSLTSGSERKYDNHIFSEYGRDRVEYLINSSWSDGMFVNIPKGKKVTINTSTVFHSAESGSRKIVVVCGDDTIVDYTDKCLSSGEGAGVQGKNIYFILGRNSKVKYLYLQDKARTVVDITYVRQIMSEYSEFNFFHINHGSSKVLFSDESVQNGDNSDFRVYGVNFTSGEQKMDIRDSSFQVGKKTNAEINVRGVITGSGTTIHRGNIDLEDYSLNSSGFYDSKILLLSKKGYANSKPGLMIKNSNTRSKHGSSISSVDSDQLFYLQSRGIDLKVGRNLITGGFVGSMIERANNREFTEKINLYSEELDIDEFF